MKISFCFSLSTVGFFVVYNLLKSVGKAGWESKVQLFFLDFFMSSYLGGSKICIFDGHNSDYKAPKCDV